MIRVLHTTEHELKRGLFGKKYNDWIGKLREAKKDRAIIFSYSAEQPEVGKVFEEVANEIKINEKILIYGECHEKGGGGGETIPTLLQFYLYFAIITISSTVAKVFLEELIKDVYKSTLHKLFDSRKKTKLRKTIILNFHNGQDSTFILESSLTTNECIGALKQVGKILKRYGSVKKYRYTSPTLFYSPKEKKWLDF